MTLDENLAVVSRPTAAAAGIASAGLGIGVAELVAGVFESLRSPVLDVGDRVVDLVPVWAKDLAIDWFGTNDKVALLAGIGAALVLYAAIIGLVALRHSLVLAGIGVGAFAAAGSTAALLARTGTSPAAPAPTIVGSIVVVAALSGFTALRRADGTTSGVSGSITESIPSPRRRFLAAAGIAASAAVGTAVIGRRLDARFSAASSRSALVLPPAVEPLPPVPPGAQAPSAASFFTANDDFYRIDTALTVPQIPAESWSLRVHGMVERELTISYAELLERDLVERDITLTCVSNTVGGGLIGTARWLGARLDDLLKEAGIHAAADQIVGRSVDGYTCGFPVSSLDGRDALVAVGMNDEPLPLAHGFPARLIVAGLYGYVSATKWLTEIEVTTFDAFDHYWVPRGYAAEAPIKLQSRIDSPRGLDRIDPGPFVIGGVAWAQTVGIEAVEVSIDDSDWMPAELAESVNDVTWRQWSMAWDATPGRHAMTVRAKDRNGAIQTSERSEPLPDGATGHHTVVVLVNDA